MPQPVKLSDSLVLDARLAGDTVQRSIAGQVEFWARLGRSVERILQGDQVLQLCRAGAMQPLSHLLETVEAAEGRARLDTYLESLPFPHYKAHPTRAGILIRTAEDGTLTVGRFINRQFVTVKDSRRKPRATVARPRSSRAAAR
jgi:hypothetical protein